MGDRDPGAAADGDASRDDEPAVDPGGRAVAERWFQALNERSIDALCALAHPEIELVPTDYTAPPGTAYHGHAGLRTFADAVWTRYPDLRFEVVSYRELDRSRLVLGRMTRTDPEHGTPEVVPRALLFDLDLGLVRRLRVYQTESEALEAAARSVEGGFRAVFDNAGDAILLLNGRGRVTDMNRSGELLLEVGRETRLGKDLADFVSGDRTPWDEGWRTLCANGQSSGTLELKTSGGRRASVSFWATADFIPGHHLVLLREREAPEDAASEPVLTPREREILTLLAEGLTSPQVAERLVLSPATVRTHVQNAVSRLEASTRVQAIAIAVARGELEPPAG